MAAIPILLLLVPVFAGFFAYAEYGLRAGLLWAGGSLVVVVVVIAWPFGLMVQAARKRAQEQNLELAEWDRAKAAHQDAPPQ